MLQSDIPVVLRPGIPPPIIRRSLSGNDIYILSAPAAMAINPSYVLGMRAIGVIRRTWGEFFRCSHWMALFPLGVIVGLLGFFGLPKNWTLMMVPVALVYYAYAVQVSCNIARELQKRGQFQDLMMIPYTDPLEMAAGMVYAMKYERARIGAAAAAFAGVALLGTGVSRRIPAFKDQALHLVVGIILLLLSVKLAKGAAVLRKDERYLATYREIEDLLSAFTQRYKSFLPRWVRLWLLTLALVCLCWFSLYHLRGWYAQLTALAICAGVLFYLRRQNAEPVPGESIARKKIYATFRDAA